MVIQLDEYLRRKQDHRLARHQTYTQSLRVNGKRSVVVFSTDAPDNVTALIATPTHMALARAENSNWNEPAIDRSLPEDPGELACDAAYMNRLYEQASLV